MTNKEKYKQAFSPVHISDEFSLEDYKMKKTTKKLNRFIASIAVCVLLVTSATVAYAANIGGIQRTIQLWICGEQTDVIVEFDGNGNYTKEYVDEEGNANYGGGGGVAIDEFDKERPLTEEELLERMSAPDVEYDEDGAVWVYWYNQKIDITDKFENDVCYVKLVNNDEILYMTVCYKDGHSTSPYKFLAP